MLLRLHWHTRLDHQSKSAVGSLCGLLCRSRRRARLYSPLAYLERRNELRFSINRTECPDIAFGWIILGNRCFCFFPMNPQSSSNCRKWQVKPRIFASRSAAQPCPILTPRFIMVLRLIPVILSIDRILEPSANAAITATCFSFASMYAMRITVSRLLSRVNSRDTIIHRLKMRLSP
jgi:hypothetical protein